MNKNYPLPLILPPKTDIVNKSLGDCLINQLYYSLVIFGLCLYIVFSFTKSSLILQNRLINFSPISGNFSGYQINFYQLENGRIRYDFRKSHMYLFLRINRSYLNFASNFRG